MKIALLTIENFRGVRSGTIQFRDDTVIIGPNNSGKTTIIEALALVLGRDRLVRSLTEHDFFGSDPQVADRIRIIATITNFGSADIADHPDWFRDGRGVPRWFDPHTGEVLAEKTDERQELACQIAVAARFDRESLEVETIRYFYDTDSDIFAEDNPVYVPAKMLREFGFFLIPASRSWDRMLSFGSELFKRVIHSASGLPAETILAERDQLRAPAEPLEDDTRLKPIVDKVSEEIRNLLGAPGLHLRLTATDSDSVLETVVPHFASTTGSMVPSKRQGSGLVSLQSLFLLLRFGQKRVEDGESFCMALEEPELHLPPPAQRRVLRRLQALSTQTIVSTHSPLVAGFCEPTALLVLRNRDGTLDAKQMLSKPLEQAATNPVRKLFQINRIETVTALMSEMVLVPEGKLDFDWLTLLTRVVELTQEGEEQCVFGIRVGLVPTQDARVKETCEALSRPHPHVCALVDGDEAGRGYVNELTADATASGVQQVLRWKDDWTIEDVIGWVIEADEVAVIEALNEEIEEPFDDLAGLVGRLKSEDRAQHGLKGDIVAYELIANVLTGRPECVRRVRRLLNGLALACGGEETEDFEVGSTTPIAIRIFKPCP